MARSLGALAACGALAAAAWSAAPSAARLEAAAKCKSGVTVVNRVRVRTFCGPAKAVVKAGGRTWRFAGGRCIKSQAGLQVGVGRYSLNTSNPSFRGFWLSSPKAKDGVSRLNVIDWQVPGAAYSFTTSTLRVAGKVTRGTFTGRVGGLGRGSGSFSCT